MNNELYHYGVLGMKWGVRRYQNADGSLTSEGKKHYSSSSKQSVPHYNLTAKEIKKNMDHMTDAELQKAINRLNNQRSIENMNPSLAEKGRKAVNRFTSDVNLIPPAIAAAIVLKKYGSNIYPYAIGLMELLK